MKTIERKCPVGKWRFQFREISGHDVDGVYLQGQRRPWPLWQIDKEQFLARIPQDQHGNPYEAAAIMWGVPSMYMQDGWNIYIWPAPAHEWTLQVRLIKKEEKEEVA